MCKSVIAFAFLVTVSTISTVKADDFSALLADLSFGDAPSLSDTPTPNNTLTPTNPLQSQQLRQAPTAFSMPAEVELQAPVASRSPVTNQPLDDLVDFEAAFALQESKAGVSAQAVGHPFHQAKHGACDSEEVCIPHTAPNLPSSSFYQYFRSNKCNSHVWDGYRQRCRSANGHVNGTCDCFKEKSKCKDRCSPIYDAPVVECCDGNVRPRRLIHSRRQTEPIKEDCDDCTACDS